MTTDSPSPAELLAAGADRAQAIADALKVMILTPAIRAFLVQNDPKALEQAERALGVYVEPQPAQPGDIAVGDLVEIRQVDRWTRFDDYRVGKIDGDTVLVLGRVRSKWLAREDVRRFSGENSGA